MEGPPTTAPALASARPDRATLRIAPVGALATLLLGLTTCAVLIVSPSGLPVPVGLMVVLPVLVFGATYSRANLAEARVTAVGLDLVGDDGVVRTIPGGSIGAMGYAGTVVAQRLVAVPVSFLPNLMGRIVVVDRAGRVVCARRAGWMKLDDVAALAAAGGVPWLGGQVRTVPGATLPPPPEMAHHHDGPVRDDPLAAAAFARQRARVRRVVLITWSLPVISTICFVVMSNVASAPMLLLGWVGGLGVAAFILGGPCVALWSSGARDARRLLRKAEVPWWPVEAVVVAGLIADANARVVGVVHPTTGEMGWWTVKWGGERGWLQGDDRGWFWFVPSGRGKRAMIAPPDRSHVAVLEQRLLSKIAVAEARSQISGEAFEWQGRQRWEAWAAAAGAPQGPPYSGASSGASGPTATM